MQIIDYDDDGRIMAITHGTDGFVSEKGPFAVPGATRRRKISDEEADKIIEADSRFYVVEERVDDDVVLKVREKTIVTLTADKTEIAGDGSETATITFDTTDAIILYINGQPETRQAYPDGLEVSTSEPKLYRFQVNDRRHWSRTLDILAKWVMPDEEK